jgi:hypothetical protein
VLWSRRLVRELGEAEEAEKGEWHRRGREERKEKGRKREEGKANARRSPPLRQALLDQRERSDLVWVHCEEERGQQSDSQGREKKTHLDKDETALLLRLYPCLSVVTQTRHLIPFHASPSLHKSMRPAEFAVPAAIVPSAAPAPPPMLRERRAECSDQGRTHAGTQDCGGEREELAEIAD